MNWSKTPVIKMFLIRLLQLNINLHPLLLKTIIKEIAIFSWARRIDFCVFRRRNHLGSSILIKFCRLGQFSQFCLDKHNFWSYPHDRFDVCPPRHVGTVHQKNISLSCLQNVQGLVVETAHVFVENDNLFEFFTGWECTLGRSILCQYLYRGRSCSHMTSKVH